MALSPEGASVPFLFAVTHTRQKRLKERFTPAPSPRGRRIMVWKAWRQELEAAGPLHLQPRSWCFICFLPFIQPGFQSTGQCCPHSGSFHLHKPKPGTPSQPRLRGLSPRWCYTVSSWQSVLTITGGGFPLSLGGNRIETSHLDARNFKIVFLNCRINWLEFTSTEHFTSISSYLYSLPPAKKCLLKQGRAFPTFAFFDSSVVSSNGCHAHPAHLPFNLLCLFSPEVSIWIFFTAETSTRSFPEYLLSCKSLSIVIIFA